MVYAVPLAKEKHGILYNRRALPVNGQRPLAILRCAAGTACVCSAFVLQEVPHIKYLRRENVGKLHKLRDEAAAAVIKMIALQIEMEPEETEADRKKIN